FKFEDLNGNGRFDAGEPGLPGFEFRIIGEGEDFTVTTGAGGVWISGELKAGTYKVEEINIPSVWVPTTDTTQTVEVKDGELSEVKFGNRYQEGKIKIFKYEDLDADGRFDAGEPGVPGFKFRIIGEGEDFTVTTGAGGVWISDELSVGDYEVREINIPDGWEPTTPTTQSVEVGCDELTEVKFGNKQIPPPPLVTIFGRKVELVGDSQFPPREPFTFELVGLGLQDVTDAEGNFRFDGLDLFGDNDFAQVEVTICEVLPPSGIWEPVDPSDGCKTFWISRGTTSKDFGIWKNRTVKEPPPEPTPPPELVCEVAIINLEKLSAHDGHAHMQASLQWDLYPNFDFYVEWWMKGELVSEGQVANFDAPLNEWLTVTAFVLHGSESVCKDAAEFIEGSDPPGPGDPPGTQTDPPEASTPAPPIGSDQNDGAP
ncbi:MAG TPA: SpaA isopeptide-forming pilin-related protein, partial [Candidatus Nanoarchaeia archaeon]